MVKKNNSNLLYAIGAAGLATAGAILYLGRKAAGEDPPVCPAGQRWDGSRCVPIIVPVGSIELSTDKIQVQPGEPAQLTAIVRDIEDQPVSGIQLHLFIGGEHQEHLSSSNSSGRVVFDLSFENPGTYSVFVSTNEAGN